MARILADYQFTVDTCNYNGYSKYKDEKMKTHKNE